MTDPQKQAIDNYLQELKELVAKRGSISHRIDRVTGVVGGMIDLLDSEEDQMTYLEQLHDVVPPEGLTAAIEQALAREGKRLSPTEIRDRVASYLRSYSNPMAAVHTVLKRLVKAERLSLELEEGKTYYVWIDWSPAGVAKRMVEAGRAAAIEAATRRRRGRGTVLQANRFVNPEVKKYLEELRAKYGDGKK